MRPFNKDSVVCFLGDSITANGQWIRRIYDYYRLEAKIPCKLYNCGVGGDKAEHGYWRLEETVFCYQPTDVVVAFGMNDSGYFNFKEAPLTDTQILERRRKLDTCIYSLRAIVSKCTARGIRVSFCTPTLPDELTDTPIPNYLGAAAAVLETSLRIRSLAADLGVDVVDFTIPFRNISLQLFKQGLTLVSPDRIHPVAEGHEFMARLFLQAQGFDVTIPQTWAELQDLAQRPHDEWENCRYRLETETNCNMHVDWDFGFGKKSPKAMDDAIARQLLVEERPHIRQRLTDYGTNRDLIPARRQALIDFTNTVES